MTEEERSRMNQLCAGIQVETDYEKFAAMLREMTELIERKEQRRFPKQPKLLWLRKKPWLSMLATARRLLPSLEGPNRKVEISISGADDLYREIRVENKFVGLDGETVALAPGAQLMLTLEAEVTDTVPRPH